jgi:uncharacterized protein (TIGR03086 family)
VSEHLREYITAVYELGRAIRSADPDRWDDPSPCEGWTARQVAGHAMGVVANVAAKLGACEPVDAFGDLDAIAGDDPDASFRRIRNTTLAALDRPGSLATPVSSSLGEMLLDDYLVSMTNDAFIHAWDIARATGADERLDPDLLEVVAARMMDAGVPRVAGRFDEAVDVDDSASLQDRLIAFTGRHP